MAAGDGTVFLPLDDHERRALRACNVAPRFPTGQGAYAHGQQPRPVLHREMGETNTGTLLARSPTSSALPRLQPTTQASPASPASHPQRLSKPSVANVSRARRWYIGAFAMGVPSLAIAALLLHSTICISPPALVFGSPHGHR